MSGLKKLLFDIVIFFLILLVKMSTSSAAAVGSKPYVHPDKSVRFQHALEDTSNGDTYVLDNWNKIHHFTAELKLVGEEVDSPMVSRVETPAEEQVFLIQPNTTRILACSVGSCGITSMKRKKQKWQWSVLDQTIPADVFSRVGIPTIATTYTDGNSTLFYVASQVTDATIPVVSVRQLNQSSTKPNFEFAKLIQRNKPDIPGTLTVHQSLASEHPIKPVFLQILTSKDPASRHSYGYFITRQPDIQSGDGMFHTRLGRFCTGDLTLASYTEVTLECHHPENYHFPIATGAALREDPVNGDYLAVTFGDHAFNSLDLKKQSEQVLCIYPMAKVNQHFDEEIQKCYQDGSGKSLKWITGEDKNCLSNQIQKNFFQKTTGDGEFKELQCINAWKSTMNGFISGKEKLTANSVDSFSTAIEGLQFSNSPLLSGLNVTPDPVLTWMYTANGTIFVKDLQLPLSADSSARSLLNSTLTWLSGNLALHAFKYANGSEYTVMNGNQIVSFPVGCGMHTECGACHENSHRLLGCGWCEGFCRSSAECGRGTWSNNTCPPKITDFTPRNGSVFGGTPISILGNYFGQSSATVEVKIGKRSCTVTAHNYTNIQCTTEPGSVGSGMELQVDVWSDRMVNTKYTCSGKIQTVDRQFNYYTPKVRSFSPTFGPIWGGTLITLEGDYLNAGAKRQVRIHDNPRSCSIVSENSTHLTCRMPSYHIDTRESKLVLEFLVDDRATSDIDTKFRYLANPTLIYEANQAPTKTIFSGGTRVYFRGENLNSTAPQPPRFSLQLEGGNRSTTVCQVENDHQLWCLTPSISSFLNGTSKMVAVNASLNLEECDAATNNCLNQNRSLEFYPDPKFTSISIEELVQEKSLAAVIKGSNLDQDLTELKVNIGHYLCNETVLVDNSTIRCTVQFVKENLGIVNPVTIKYGNLMFNLPSLNISDPSPMPIPSDIPSSPVYSAQSSDTAGLIIGIVTGVLVVSVLLALIYMRKKPWMRKIFHVGPAVSADSTLHPYFNPYNVRYPGQLVLPDEKDSLSDTDETICTTVTGFSSPQRAVLNPHYWKSVSQPGLPSPPLSPINNLIESIVKSLKLEKNIVQPWRLKLDEKIGEGHFGSVYKGSFYATDDINSNEKPMIVAVKCLRENHLLSKDSVKKFLEECAVMVNLSHDNVMRLEGICFDEDEYGNLDPRLILPFMANGDLHKYIKHQPPLAIYSVLDLSIQIAKGMRYLSNEAYSQRLVHRDLAARNCMLDENMKVIIADFGLSRDVQELHDGMYVPTNVQTVPFRWLAPECLANNHYSTKSDVWSFGVVIWELFERGRLPYDPTFSPERLMNYLLDGHRLEKPANCTPEVYNLMLLCWESDPAVRPDFEELVFRLVDVRKHYPVEVDGYVTTCGTLRSRTDSNK